MARKVCAGLAVAFLALTACAQTDSADETVEETETADATMTAEAEPAESVEASGTEDAAASDDPGRESAMTIEELVTEPETFLGQEIFVTGQIGEELDDEHAFTIESIEETDALLVVNEGDVVFQEIDDDDLVMVQGTLVEFDAEAMEEAGAELTPEDEALADYDGEHVLVATDVEQTDED